MSKLYNALIRSKNPVNVIQYATPSNSRNGATCNLKLQNGTLLFTWSYFGGDPVDLDPSEIWAKISTDNGKSWKDAYRIIAVPAGYTSVSIPSCYQKANGDIILLCSRFTAAGTLGFVEIWKYISTDNGLTFTEVAKVYSSAVYEATGDYYTFGAQRLFKTSTGRLVFPFCVFTAYAISSETANTVGRALYSDDEGDTWTLSATEIIAAASGAEALLAESAVGELPNGNLLRTFRTRSGFVRISTSTDDGETWSTPPTKSATLTASNSSVWWSYVNGKCVAIVDRPEGGVVNGVTARVHMDLWKSDDLGVTWSFVLNIAYTGVNVYTEPTIYDKGSSIIIFHTKAPADGVNQSIVFTEILYSQF